jgi:hypothetical protein
MDKIRCQPLAGAMLANEPLHRIAARLRILLKPKGYGGAANGDRQALDEITDVMELEVRGREESEAGK